MFFYDLYFYGILFSLKKTKKTKTQYFRTERSCIRFFGMIGERNKWLAENCDMMIVYIKRDYGGAYKCYKYAQKLGVPIMNIADNIKNQGKI